MESAAEVIDLTKSLPSSPEKTYESSRILKFTAYIHSRKIRFKVKKSCLPSWTFNPNPNPNPTNLGTSLFSQATDQLINKEPWTPKAHQQFLMGLMKYGGGRWNKIAKFVKNKTARQVERHATSFFINFLETYLSSSTAAIASNNNKTDLGTKLASVLNPNPKINKMKNKEGEGEGEEDMGAPRTLMLFSNGSEASSSSNNNGISEINTTRTCVADDDGEVDLELRLG